MKTNEFTVYLAGPIEFGDIKRNLAWRDKAEEFFEPYGIRTLNPVRGRNQGEEEFNGEEAHPFLYNDEGQEISHNEIVDRDLYDIDRSNLFFACMPDVRMVGTNMELFYSATVRKIPTIVVTKVYAGHPWIQKYSTRILSHLDEGLDYVVRYWVDEDIFKKGHEK